MNLPKAWVSEVDYGRKLLSSGIAGAYCGEEVYLHGRGLTPLLNRSARQALRPAVVGAFLGLLGGYQALRRRSASRALELSFLGGAIGFGAGLAWDNRGLVASVTSGAMKNIGRTRDQHWLEKHPIDYA